MRKWVRMLVAVLAAYVLFTLIAGIVLAEGSLHLRHLPLTHRAEFAAELQQQFGTSLQDVSIQAAAGAVLKAWYIHPQISNGNAVILLHGITDNREGVFGYGILFLQHGYSVLLPDARGHGESGGALATYGIRESDDTHRWISWLYAHHPPSCVYGFGESYGAALILQSVADEPRYCAVAVEDAFSSAREMSYDRVSEFLHLGSWFGRTIGRPIIASAVWYAKKRYGIDLLEPSPAAAVRDAQLPVLLIQGANDQTINPRHALILAAAAPMHVQLWLVPGAGHTMAWAAAPHEFEQRVLGWFALHPEAGKN